MKSYFFCLVILATAINAHPHHYGHPRFYNEERPMDHPTVNVFKIYAPRLFYMPGYNPSKNSADFAAKSKQMIPETESIFDGIMRAELFPDSIFDSESNSLFDYDDDYVPAPSNIVSRKLPPYFEPEMNPDAYEAPPMHLDEYHPPMHNNEPRNFMDTLPPFNNIYDAHDENCEHHEMFHNINAFPEVQTFRLATPMFLNNDNSHEGSSEAAIVNQLPLFTSVHPGPLTTFFKKITSGPESTDTKMNAAEVTTTVTYGQPEIFQEQVVDKTPVIIASDASADANEGSTAEEIDIIITEVDSEAEADEIERNIIRSTLQENAANVAVVEEQNEADNEITNDYSEGNDVPVEEVEVNIVKTILPDDSYLVSEAGGEDEKIQDEVISMIQNSESPTDPSKGSVFISRYLQTPNV